MKVFLDTNVIIDFFGKREPNFEFASDIIALAKNGMLDLVVSSLSFVNAAYILRKKFDRKELDTKLENLLDLCKVSKIDGDMIKDAINRHSYDFEGCVQYLSSKTKNVDVIITGDKKGFADLNTPYMTAEDFIKLCKQ